MTIVEHQAGDHQTHHSNGVMLRNLLPLPPSAQHRAETAKPIRSEHSPVRRCKTRKIMRDFSSRISMAPRAAEKVAWAQSWLAVMASSPWSCGPLMLAVDR